MKSCGSGAAVLALSPGEAKAFLTGDGGKRAVLREEHEVSRKAIAQGRPECSRCPVCSCAICYAQIARETAGAASTRSSLRPLILRRANEDANLGRIVPRERDVYPRHCERSEAIHHPRSAWIASLRSQRRGEATVSSPDERSVIWIAPTLPRISPRSSVLLVRHEMESCHTGSAIEYFTWLSAKLDSIEAMPSSRVSLFFRNAS